MRLLPCSLFALWTCAVAASGTTSSTSPEPPLFSQVGSEPLAASASSGRLAACVEACLAQTHVAGAEASDEVGRVREMLMARLRRMELAHQKELAELHFKLRIGQLLVAAQSRARNPRSPPPPPPPISPGVGVGVPPPICRGAGVHPHPPPRFGRGSGVHPLVTPTPTPDLPESGIQLSTIEYCKGVEFRLPHA